MSSIFGLKKPNTNLRKNVFDLSEKVLLSMSAGMLVPVMVKEANPGEKFKMSMASLTRTKPLNTAAFVRNRQYFHYFFVPYRQLWNGWDNFINGVRYDTSALMSNKPRAYQQVPMMSLFKALKMIADDKKLYMPSDHSTSAFDELGFEHYLGISRLLDMLGYGFSTTIAESGTSVDSADGRTANRTGPSVTTTTKVSSVAEFVKHIMLNPTRLANFYADNANDMRVNPFRLLAYQKIYSDFYKRDDYESTNARHFNIDDLAGVEGETIFGETSTARFNADRLLNMMKLRYRWQPKDYFTGVVPSELYNVGSIIDGISNLGAGQGLGLNAEELGSLTGGAKNTNDGNNGIKLYDGSTWQSSVVSTKTIRSAFAIEKLLRLTRRAGGHDYISQTAAHYGFDVPKGRGDKVEFLGGFTANINISEVITTADTDRGFAGQIYGNGVGSLETRDDIEFTAKEHGIIMCIASVVPELDYSAEGLSAFNSKFMRGDYFHPELQDLGLQPVFGYELNNYWHNRATGVVSEPIVNGARSGMPGFIRGYTYKTDTIQEAVNLRGAVLGFNPRYYEYKASFDRLHGEYRNGRSLAMWSASNLLSHKASGLMVNTLKINPKSLDRVFAVGFDGTEASDQFMVACQFVTKAIRPMSITGQGL